MLNKIIIFLIFALFVTGTVYALRVAQPPTLQHPIDEDQINDLNKFLEDMWLMHQGRFEFDIVDTSKANAKNGEMWLLTGATAKIQFKMNDTVYSVSVD